MPPPSALLTFVKGTQLGSPRNRAERRLRYPDTCLCHQPPTWAVVLLAHSWVSLPKLLIPDDRKARVMRKEKVETGRLKIKRYELNRRANSTQNQRLLSLSNPIQPHTLQVPISRQRLALFLLTLTVLICYLHSIHLLVRVSSPLTPRSPAMALGPVPCIAPTSLS